MSRTETAITPADEARALLNHYLRGVRKLAADPNLVVTHEAVGEATLALAELERRYMDQTDWAGRTLR